MDNSVHEQGSQAQQDPRRFLAGLGFLASLLNWLAGLFRLTEEEREDAGIYLDRLGGE